VVIVRKQLIITPEGLGQSIIFWQAIFHRHHTTSVEDVSCGLEVFLILPILPAPRKVRQEDSLAVEVIELAIDFGSASLAGIAILFPSRVEEQIFLALRDLQIVIPITGQGSVVGGMTDSTLTAMTIHNPGWSSIGFELTITTVARTFLNLLCCWGSKETRMDAAKRLATKNRS